MGEPCGGHLKERVTMPAKTGRTSAKITVYIRTSRRQKENDSEKKTWGSEGVRENRAEMQGILDRRGLEKIGD